MSRARLPEHDPATCPGCLRAAMPDYDADLKQDAGGAAAWAVAAIGIVFVGFVGLVFALALYLIAGNTFAVLAR